MDKRKNSADFIKVLKDCVKFCVKLVSGLSTTVEKRQIASFPAVNEISRADLG